MAPTATLGPATYTRALAYFRATLTVLAYTEAAMSPFNGICPRCAQPIVIAAGDVALEAETLERFPCPQCASVAGRQHGHRSWCVRCKGTRVLGEPLPKRGVILDGDGNMRPFRGRRREGEAVHALHDCGR